MLLLRDEVKYIRDYSKSQYNKGTQCYICGATEDLHFHHYYSLSQLYNKWKAANKIIVHSVDEMLAVRERFHMEHKKEIYEDTVTLCKHHHADCLHKVYGASPPLHTAEKQKRWVELQREKHNAKLVSPDVRETESSTEPDSRFRARSVLK
jgi:hypothetical protein